MTDSLTGYMLLPSTSIPPYRGIDRDPYLPLLTQDLVESELPVHEEGANDSTWPFCPPGWRRDAYRLYEENLVPDAKGNSHLIRDRIIAERIKLIIEPQIGYHEILFCEISEIGSPIRSSFNEGTFLGYDIAYLGGDYFSAIRAGFFGSPWFRNKPNEILSVEFKSLLNEYGLFSSTTPISKYVSRFIEEAPSEVNAEFYVWSLTLC